MLIDYRDLKSAGVYTFEVDNTKMPIVQTSALRLLVGWNPTGPFNVPVFVGSDRDRKSLFGDIDPKFEEKGAFLNRAVKTALQAGPVFALNLLPVDNADKTNYAVMSLDSAVHNPDQTSSASVGRNKRMNKKEEQLLPNRNYRETNYGGFIGVAALPDLYDRVRFWNPSPENLLKVFRSGDDQVGTINDSNVRQPLLGFGNTGTKDVSLLVFKPGSLTGYDVTAREWYGGEESIPYKWIRPSDYISDYFIQVVAIQGLWSNFQSYAADPYWSTYFTDHGIKYDKLREFMSTNSITQIGSWTGCIIPDFVDQTGANDYIITKINNSSYITGITAALNVEALNSIDINLENNATGGEADKVQVNPDFCVDHATDLGSAPAPFQIDLVGHNRTTDDESFTAYNFLSYNYEPRVKDVEKTDAYNAGTAIFNNVRYFGSYNTVVVPQQDTPNSEKLKSNAVEELYKNGFVKAVKEFIDYEKNRTVTEDYLGDTKFTDADKSLSVKLYKLRELAKEKLVQYINSAANFAYRNATDADKIADMIKDDPIGRSVNAFADLSETCFLHNMSSSANQIESYDGTDEIGDIKERMLESLIPGLTHISNIQTVDLDTLLNMNDNLTGSLRLNQNYINKLKKNNKSNSLYKVITCIDPILLCKMADGKKVDIIVEPEDDADAAEAMNELIHSLFHEETMEEVKKDKLRHDGYFAPYTDEDQKNKNDIFLWPETEFGTYLQYDEETGEAVENIGGLTDNYIFENTAIESEDKKGYIYTETILSRLRDCIVTALEELLDALLEEIMEIKQPDIDSAKIDQGIDIDNLPDEIDPTAVNPKFAFGATPLGADPEGGDSNKSLINPDKLVKDAKKEGLNEADTDYYAVFQYPINSSEISEVLRFIPLRGLELKARHMPGFDTKGCRSLEDGVEKIYAMLMDPGIYRGLMNPDMIEYRYIVDTMTGGLRPSLGGKVYLSRLAKARGKCTALLNAPSIKAFTASTNPYFCDVYNQGSEPRPPFDSKYVPLGGNKKMIASNNFSLMDEGDGATYAGVFTPYLKYVDGNKEVLVPPAADVSNTFIRKFNGGDPYAIVANTKGVLSGTGLSGVEYMLDKYDRDNFEPYGLNSIIQRNNQIMIYSNRTAYQRVRSDFNFLHVRELLNTIETEVEAVLQNFVFEYNNAITRGAIITLVNPILSTMRDAGAIYNYELEFNETPDDSAMIGDEVAVLSIGVVVNKGMEKIVQVISVNKRGKITLVR